MPYGWRVRVATFNVMHGRSASDGRVDIARFPATIAAIDADVLALQEVDRAQPRSGGHDLTASAAAAMGGEGRFAPALMGTPGGAWRAATPGDASRRDEPAYGVALITRLPVRRWVSYRMPSLPLRAPIHEPGPGGGIRWMRDEPRVLLAAVLDVPIGDGSEPGRPMTVAATHLSFVPGWNALQLRRVRRVLRRLPPPRLLLGDLNLPRWAARRLTAWRALAPAPTYPVHRPWVQLDHILGEGPGLPPVTATRTLAMPISDHRALVADLSVGT